MEGKQTGSRSAPLGRALGRAGIVMGWASLAGFGLAFAIEVTGLPEVWVERALTARLGWAAGRVKVDDVDLTWTSRSATLHGLTLGEDGSELSLERLRLRVGWRLGRGLVLERAEAEHGRLRVSRAMISGLEGLLEPRRQDGPSDLPELVVRDLAIAVETEGYGDLEVGLLDAALARDGEGQPRVSGRLVPALDEGGRTGDIYLEGRMNEQGLLLVRGAARDLPLTTAFLPDAEAFDPLRELAPLALFDLEATASWELGRDVLPTAEARLGLAGGSLALPWLDDADARRVRDIVLALEVAFDPGDPLALWDGDAWRAVGHATARWEQVALEANVFIGRAAADGRLAEAWVHAPRAPLDERLLEVGAHRHWLVNLYEALEPAGVAELAYGVALPRGWTPEDGFMDSTDRAVAVLTRGEARAAYRGWPGPSGNRDQGFPLAFEELTGRVHYVHRPGRELAEELSIHDLRGRSDEDRVRVRCSSWYAPTWNLPAQERTRGARLFHLLAESDGIEVGDRLRPALQGLTGLKGCEELWSEYLPTGGRLGARVELLRDGRRPEMASDVQVTFDGFAARWAEFPVLCDGVFGRLHIVGEGRGAQGRSVTSLALTGRSVAARGPVVVEGRAEFGPRGPGAMRWEVRADGLDLAGTHLREALGQRDRRTLAGLESLDATGHADLRATFARTGAAAPDRRWLEVTTTPEGVRLVPQAFPLEMSATQGRVLATWAGPAAGEASPADLRLGVLARWAGAAGGVPVWLAGRFPDEGPGRVEVLGAGIDPVAPTLVDALEASLSRGADESVELDLTSIDARGRFDFGAALEASGTGELETAELVLQARLEHLGLERTELLRDLRGRVTWNRGENVWRGPMIRGVLGRTPVTLSDAIFTQPAEGGWELEADLQADGLPIDRQHLRFFLDARTMRTLLEDFGARGRFDIGGGRLHLSADPEGVTALRFQGQLRVRDLSLRIGLPIEVRAAEQVDLDLRIEGGRVRALARVGRLFGSVADRLINDAHLQLTYIEPRLTIEALDGDFEGGRLRSLGGRGGSTFFAVDLQPPFPFVLAGRMHQIEVGRLLRGVFNSSFANQGMLDATLQLRGDLEHLTAITGGGRFDLSDSSLWAIPVFQAVFSRLGFETSATFSSMQGAYQIDGGVVAFPDLRLESDLLSLVGAGTIDFDGSLVHDLEVRYALLDQFGPLTRLLYEIQNSLLRISVRGDMSRPEVVVKGLFSQFFSAPSGRQRLPLPRYATLPARF